MAQSVPANFFNQVTPGVLSAGGNGLVLQGLLLTQNTRFPIGAPVPFVSSAAVAAYAGPAVAETAFAAQYFAGFTNSPQKPASLLIAQYPETAVAAWIRGGSLASLPLISLQAVSGTLAISVDGAARSGTVTLAGAASFSAAATSIATALNTSLPAGGTSTTSTISTNTVTGSITGNILTVTAATVGLVAIGQTVTGGTTAAGTTITGFGTGTGGTGTYTVSISQTVVSGSLTLSGGILTVAGTVTGTWAVGQTVTGGTTAANTHIIGLGTGVGAAGTYLVDVSQTVTSAALASSATAVAVTFDSVTSAFVITSGVTGVASTVAFPTTGSVATTLALTSATGAVLSQGAAATTPAAFMAGLVNQTVNWVSFTHLWQSTTSEMLAFAAWNSAQGYRYLYVAWDALDSTVIGNPLTYTGLGSQIAAAGLSGAHLIWAPINGYLDAAFVLGFAASLDYTATNGRTELAYRSASGLSADVTNSTALANLIANGFNTYTNCANPNETDLFYWNGDVTGIYLWLDTYINQIWLNAQFLLNITTAMRTYSSIPYNSDGDALIKASVQGTITQARNFGVFRPGVQLSTLQVAQVNTQAGKVIAPTLSAQGWYLLSNAAGTAPAVRQARGSPPFQFWYTDGQSVQSLNLQSIVLQ